MGEVAGDSQVEGCEMSESTKDTIVIFIDLIEKGLCNLISSHLLKILNILKYLLLIFLSYYYNVKLSSQIR